MKLSPFTISFPKSVDKYFLLSSAKTVIISFFNLSCNNIAPIKFAPYEIPTPIPNSSANF